MSITRYGLILAALASMSCEALFARGNNPKNCVVNPGICEAMGPAFSCDPMTERCETKGVCTGAIDCMTATAAACTDGQCVPCTADNQCKGWSTSRQISPARNYCVVPGGASGGSCGQCGTNMHCAGNAAGAFCDPVTLECRGCLAHSECDSAAGAGDGVCKRPGDPATVPGTTGQCVAASSIAYLGNNPAGCEMNGANPSSPSKPYCNLTVAMASGKSVIKVLPSATPYPGVSLAMQTVTLIGPGRDANPGATFSSVDLNGTGTLTLSDLVVSAMAGTTLVQCRGGGKLNVIASNINGSLNGIDANACSALTIERTRVSTPSRLAIQAGGSGATTYRIVNSLIVDSGGGGAMHPVRLGLNATGVFNYNTITRSDGSVQCLNPLELSNSVLVMNGMPPSGCMASSSVTDDAVTLEIGPEPKLQRTQAALAQSIDKGSKPSQGEVQTDYFGAQRPKGQGWDKGYHELE